MRSTYTPRTKLTLYQLIEGAQRYPNLAPLLMAEHARKVKAEDWNLFQRMTGRVAA